MKLPFAHRVYLVNVPTIFVEDHVSRALDRDEDGTLNLSVVKRGKRVSTIHATGNGLADLMNDASYYSTFDPEEYRDSPFLRSIVGSAKSTVAAILREHPEMSRFEMKP